MDVDSFRRANHTLVHNNWTNGRLWYNIILHLDQRLSATIYDSVMVWFLRTPHLNIECPLIPLTSNRVNLLQLDVYIAMIGIQSCMAKNGHAARVAISWSMTPTPIDYAVLRVSLWQWGSCISFKCGEWALHTQCRSITTHGSFFTNH